MPDICDPELPSDPEGGEMRPPDGAQVESLVAAWREELSGQVSVSSSGVQDHLLDLWGKLPEGQRRSQIESWLTETLERNLYAVADIEARLASVAAPGPVS